MNLEYCHLSSAIKTDHFDIVKFMVSNYFTTEVNSKLLKIALDSKSKKCLVWLIRDMKLDF